MVAIRESLRHRAAAIAAVALLALIVIAILASGSDDEEPEQARPEPPSLAVPESDEAVTVRGTGISVQPPRGWATRRTRRSIQMRSPDRTTLVVVSAPPRARRPATLLRGALAEIRARYRDVSIGGTAGSRLGRRPGISRVVSARNRRGTRLRVLVAAARGRRRAWLAEVFSAEGAPQRRLVEGQVALRSLRLSG
jgi:hypothetical protein